MTHRRWLSAVFLLLMGATFFLIIGLLLSARIVRQPDFPRAVGDPSLVAQEWAFRVRGMNCEVLIYGDSTASVGVDPRVVKAQTGLTACNIASNRPVVDDLGTMPVDAFWAHNPRPKVLVLQFGPELFFRGSGWEHNGPYAPLVMVIRNASAKTAAELLMRHPPQAIQLLSLFLKYRILPNKADIARLQKVYSQTIPEFYASSGRLNLDLPAQTSCLSAAQQLYGPLDVAWIRQLRQRYEALGIIVLIKAAPVPECDPQLRFFQQALAPYVDQNVETMPIGMFVPGDRHPTAEGARAETLRLANLIEKHLTQH